MCSRPGVAEGKGPNPGTAVIALGWKSWTRPVVFFVENDGESGGPGLLPHDGIRWPDNPTPPAGGGTGRLFYSGKELGRVMKGTRRTIWFMIPGYGQEVNCTCIQEDAEQPQHVNEIVGLLA